MQSLWSIKDSNGFLDFHLGQSQAWDSNRRFIFVLAGTQGGKTTFGPWWLWREILNTASESGGDNDYIAATATFDLFKLKMLPALRETFERVLGVGRYWAGDRVIELRDPSTGKFWARHADDQMWGRIIMRSAAAGGGLESLTGKAAWLDECGQDEFGIEAFEAVLRRLSLAQGRVLGTTTVYNIGWLKTEVMDRFEAGDRDYDVIQFDSIENPSFPRAEYERAKRTMPAWRFNMFYRGLFARPAGLIYDCVEDYHYIDEFEIPGHWPRWVGIDFGAVNTALIWIAEDLIRNRFVVYRESLTGGKTTAQHASEALDNAYGENIVGWHGGSKSESQQRMDWADGGVDVQGPVIVDVEAGIDRVTQLLKSKRLFIFRTCKGLQDELGSYRRKLDSTGQPTDEIEQKRKYHRLDALRYVGQAIYDSAGVGDDDLLEVVGSRGY